MAMWRQIVIEKCAIDGYAYQPYYCQGRIYIARGPWHFGDFRNNCLPNIGEDQKKSHHPKAGLLALCDMVNPAQVIALRSYKG